MAGGNLKAHREMGALCANGKGSSRPCRLSLPAPNTHKLIGALVFTFPENSPHTGIGGR